MSQFIPVSFTMQEIQVLSRLLDIAVKAGGMAVAGDAFILHQKLALSVEQSKQEEKTEA